MNFESANNYFEKVFHHDDLQDFIFNKVAESCCNKMLSNIYFLLSFPEESGMDAAEWAAKLEDRFLQQPRVQEF